MMDMIRSGKGTLHHQVLSALVGAIRSGEFKVGDKLPTEAELVERYGVSRTTARRALDELSRQGVVRREPGRGTYLADPRLYADSPYLRSFTDEIERLGYRPGARLLDCREVDGGPEVAEKLGVGETEAVFFVRRLRTADELPIFVCDSYLPLERFPALRDADFAQLSLYELFERSLGHGIVGAKQWISAGTASEDVASLLGLEAGQPVLQLERVTFARGDVPLESVTAYFHPERYRYYSELVPQPGEMASLTEMEIRSRRDSEK